MKTGLVFGKFLPLHQGHLALINFALQHCDSLIVLVCASGKENISGDIRLQWVQNSFSTLSRVVPQKMEYDEAHLPNISVSSREVSKVWATYFTTQIPSVNIVFTSELYGDYLAEYMNIEHRKFDIARTQFHISASEILQNPYKHWHFIAPAAKHYFVKKVAILGSESTGKSTLTQKLAANFNTTFVPEMAREIIEKTNEVMPDDLLAIATLHAQTINERIQQANRLLIVDTDITITQSYSRYLFKQELVVPEWIKNANRFDLYIFLETDCPFVQDGTRLAENEREVLSASHKTLLRALGISCNYVSGNWEERIEQSKKIIQTKFSISNNEP